MIDHVAYTVSKLHEDDLDEFMGALGFVPFAIPKDAPQAAYEATQRQRWYTDGGECDVHIVEHSDEADLLGWGHFCVLAESGEAYENARDSQWLARDNDTGRVWLAYNGLRVEVRTPSNGD